MKLSVQVKYCYIQILFIKCPLRWCPGVGVADFHAFEVCMKSLKWLRSAAPVTPNLESLEGG